MRADMLVCVHIVKYILTHTYLQREIIWPNANKVKRIQIKTYLHISHTNIFTCVHVCMYALCTYA